MDDIQSWWEVPSIAHFCSLFRAAFNLFEFDIEVCELEEALLTDGTEDCGSSLLQELMVRLLCGCYGSQDISTSNYQMFLRRLFRQKCQEYGRDNPFNTDMDFQFLPLRTKVEILHALCDFRLDADDVQDLLRNLEADNLRVEPLGHDQNRSAYWYFFGTRLYREDYPRSRRTKEKRKKGKEEKKRKKHCKSVLDFRENGSSGEWQVVCYTQEDWRKMFAKFKHSRYEIERELYSTLRDDFVTEIPRLFAEKDRSLRKQLMEFQPRRQSSRLEKLKQQKEEVKSLQKCIEKKEKERRQKMEEKNKKLRQSRSVKESRANRARIRSQSRTNSECGSVGSSIMDLYGESSRSGQNTTFVGRQTNNSLSSATGQIVIQGLRRKLRSSQVFRQTEEDLQTGMYKILEFIKNHEDAWPFLEPVDEEYAPRYYSIVIKPMDLQRMEDKLDEGEYLTFSDFKSDFQLIVDNCRKYNGPENEYTDMVGNLQNAFQSAVDRYLESETSSDEEIAVDFIEKVPEKRAPIHRPRPKKKKQIVEIQEEPIRSPSLSPSIPPSPSSDESDKLPDVEEESEEKPGTTVEAPDSDDSSTKDEVEAKSLPTNTGAKQKMKTGTKSAPDIEALELATEQTLKDINKWLDDTPRYSEFSSASNSPSHFISTEEYEAGSRVESEYRRNVKVDKPSRSRDPKDNSKRRSSKDPTKQMRRREVQRTIERLQPGKSKGNLISNIQNIGKTSEEGPPGKPKDTRSSSFPVVDETTPKLSLGTVLGTDVLGFGVGQSKHNFDQEKNEEDKSVLVLEEPPKPIIDTRPKTPDPPVEMENSEEFVEKKDKEEIEIKQITKDCRQEKAMPNLSAWFKAFGAPKPLATSKKKSESLLDGSSIDIINSEERRDGSNIFATELVEKSIPSEAQSVIVHDSPRQSVVVETSLEESETRGLVQHKNTDDVIVSPAPLPNSQQVTPRQRKVSTGSTVSEPSSFSQDLMDPVDGSSPRLNLEDRIENYSAPYQSPLHQLPVEASPITSSPRPEDAPNFASYPPLNGSIRAGFYQDTSFALQKSSPEKPHISSHSSKEPPCSPFPMYSPQMYPTPDHGGFIAYQQSSPPSTPETVYENSSSYTGPLMTFYDTSKPLTDQYRAARTQESDVYQSHNPPTTVSTRAPSRFCCTPPPPLARIVRETPEATIITMTPPILAHQSSLPGFPVKKRLYSEIEMGSSSQSANKYQAPSLSPPPAHAQSTGRPRPPMRIILENAHHYKSLSPPCEVAENIIAPTSEKMYSVRKSAVSEPILERSEHRVLHVSKKHQIIKTVQSNSNNIESTDRLPQSSPETFVEFSNKSPLPLQLSPPSDKDTVVQASEAYVPEINTIKKHFEQNNSGNLPCDDEDDDDDCKVIKIQPSTVPVITSSRIFNHQAHQKMSHNLNGLQGMEKHQQISAADNDQSVLESSIESIHPGTLHASNVASTIQNSVPERLKSNTIAPLHANDMSYHRGPFSPIPPSPIGMEHLALHGNLSNLSHVDRFPSSERLLSGLPSPASPFFGEKGVSSQYVYRQNVPSTLPDPVSSPSSSPMAILSQQSPVMTMAYNHESQITPSPIPFNRSVPELPSVLPNKVSTIQGPFNRSVQDLSTGIPSKSSSSINVTTTFDRPMCELSTVHSNKTMSTLNSQTVYQSVTSVLPAKVTTPVDLKSYNQSATDLSTGLPNKLSIPPVGAPSIYSQSTPDYSLLVGKTSDAQPAPKPSRKRKSKQTVASSSDVPVVTTTPSSTAFQQYVGLNTSPNVTEPSAIALKTATVLTGSAFNFGPAHTGLGIYSPEKDGYPAYLEDYRTVPSSYYIPTPDPNHDKINAASHPSAPAPPLPFPFSSHSRPPSYALAQAFINHQTGLVDPAGSPSPLYQQYLHRHPEELLRHSGSSMVLHQGLLAPSASYTASFHPALGIRQPYDSLNRPTWL